MLDLTCGAVIDVKSQLVERELERKTDVNWS